MKKISIYDSLAINSGKNYCVLDGRRYKTYNGVWTFYIPKIQTKWFHSRDQKLLCLSEKAPKNIAEIAPDADYGIYTFNDWKTVLSECIFTKAATNYVIIDRLHQHGLGPKPLGFSIVKHASSADNRIDGCCVGVEVENISKLKRKPKATEADLTKAGIITDKINSSIRQQIRGYVSDLNSVVSVSLMEHDERIEDLATMLKLSRAMF